MTSLWQQRVWRCNKVFPKGKGFAVKFEEVSDGVSPWIPIVVKPPTIIQNMLPRFNRVWTTRTQKVFPREELESVFTDRCMVDNDSGSSSAKRVGVTEIL